MSHLLTRRHNQQPNMVTPRKLPPGPGPLSPDGKRINYKVRTLNNRSCSPSGPVKAVHPHIETKCQAASPVGNYYSSSISNLGKGLSNISLEHDVIPTSYSRTSSSIPNTSKCHLQKNKLTSTGIGQRNLYSSVYDNNSSREESRLKNSPALIGTTNRNYQSTYNASFQKYDSPRRRSQSFDSNRNVTMKKEFSFPSSLRPSELENKLTLTSRLPKDTIAGSGFSQSNKDLRGRVGLMNIGNTCFMNSVLQCLCNCQLLQDYIIQDNYLLHINERSSRTRGNLIKAFAFVMKNLWAPEISTRTYFSPKKFKDCLDLYFDQFRGARQHDSQEFLRYLLEALHEDTNTVKRRPQYKEVDDQISEEEKARMSWDMYIKRESSFISDLFVGQLKSVLECNDCQNRSVTFDPFWDLSLPIPRNKRDTTLIDCFKEFTQQEILDANDRPTCSKCKAKRKCSKSLSIQRFPKILVIHLKRFSGHSKLSNFVDFPVSNLSLAQFASKSCNIDRYQLIATSNHSGFTYGGHYIAHAKHAIRNKWYCYDDTKVDELCDGSIKSSQAYVLFYQQQHTARL